MLLVLNPDAPVPRLNRLRSTAERDQQAGYRFIFAGAKTGIRNPRAHEHAGAHATGHGAPGGRTYATVRDQASPRTRLTDARS